MSVRLFVSSTTASNDMRYKQTQILGFLAAKGVEFETVDISDPSHSDDRKFMRVNAKAPQGKTPLPPQVFFDDDYCGDYEAFFEALESENLYSFLKLPVPEEEAIFHREPEEEKKDEEKTEEEAENAEKKKKKKKVKKEKEGSGSEDEDESEEESSEEEEDESEEEAKRNEGNKPLFIESFLTPAVAGETKPNYEEPLHKAVHEEPIQKPVFEAPQYAVPRERLEKPSLEDGIERPILDEPLQREMAAVDEEGLVQESAPAQYHSAVHFMPNDIIEEESEPSASQSDEEMEPSNVNDEPDYVKDDQKPLTYIPDKTRGDRKKPSFLKRYFTCCGSSRVDPGDYHGLMTINIFRDL